MSLNREQIIEILNHYADPILDHGEDESCGQCQRALIDKKAAEEELARPDPSYYAFVRKSTDMWKESKHYRIWHEISRTIPEGTEKAKRIEIITQKMREMGLEP